MFRIDSLRPAAFLTAIAGPLTPSRSKGLGGIFDSFSKIGGVLLGGPGGFALGGALCALFGGGTSSAGRGQVPALAFVATGSVAGPGAGMGGFAAGHGMDAFTKIFDRLETLFESALGTGASTGASTTTGTSSTPTSSASGGGSPLVSAAGRAYDQMASVEQEIANLDPNDKDYQKKLMQLQQKMQKLQQLVSLISNILKMQHDSAMKVIGNIRS